ncbi:MAG: hypothetical protein ABI288_07510 [Ginsengibacter sp.]
MFKKAFLYSISLLLFCPRLCLAQYDVPLYTSYTTVAARIKLYDRLVNNTIIKNLSMPLTDSTEENWQNAFTAMEVLNFKTPFTLAKLHTAFQDIEIRSAYLQKALMEVVYCLYPETFSSQAAGLLHNSVDPKVFAMCTEYLIWHDTANILKRGIEKRLLEKFRDSISVYPVLSLLQTRLQPSKFNKSYSIKRVLEEILKKDFLPNKIVMYSFQRKNRDFPGRVIIRNAVGNFITDSSGKIFSIPQLARSISNLPSYLTNGNTPTGIYRMYGFGVSMSNFIGPSANVQMGMPVELRLQNFFDNTAISDSVWTIDWYQKLIPSGLKAYLPLYNSYYAGLAGRSEIIAHGTTIDPNWYHNKPYYPLTPTQGCLCTKEIWDGKRVESDQQKLVNGLLKAGGAKGYCVVIEIDDSQTPVLLKDILPYLPTL